MLHVEKEFVVVLDNAPGTLAAVATALGNEGVDIRGFLAQSQGEFGVLRLVTSDAERTERWLRNARHRFRVHDVLAIEVHNSPGDLGRIASRLAGSGINVAAAYPSLDHGRIRLTLAVDDLVSARKVLS